MSDLTNAAGILSYPYEKKIYQIPISHHSKKKKRKENLKTPGRSNIKYKAFNFQKKM